MCSLVVLHPDSTTLPISLCLILIESMMLLLPPLVGTLVVIQPGIYLIHGISCGPRDLQLEGKEGPILLNSSQICLVLNLFLSCLKELCNREALWRMPHNHLHGPLMPLLADRRQAAWGAVPPCLFLIRCCFFVLATKLEVFACLFNLF